MLHVAFKSYSWRLKCKEIVDNDVLPKNIVPLLIIICQNKLPSVNWQNCKMEATLDIIDGYFEYYSILKS